MMTALGTILQIFARDDVLWRPTMIGVIPCPESLSPAVRIRIRRVQVRVMTCSTQAVQERASI